MTSDWLEALMLAMMAPVRCEAAPYPSCAPLTDRLVFLVNPRCAWPRCTKIARPAAPEMDTPPGLPPGAAYRDHTAHTG